MFANRLMTAGRGFATSAARKADCSSNIYGLRGYIFSHYMVFVFPFSPHLTSVFFFALDKFLVFSQNLFFVFCHLFRLGFFSPVTFISLVSTLTFSLFPNPIFVLSVSFIWRGVLLSWNCTCVTYILQLPILLFYSSCYFSFSVLSLNV
jgi:hypothetical protein